MADLKPKKPLSAFFRFMTREQAKDKVERPEDDIKTRRARINQAWSELSNDDKVKLQEEYKVEKAEYDKLFKEWSEKYPELAKADKESRKRKSKKGDKGRGKKGAQDDSDDKSDASDSDNEEVTKKNKKKASVSKERPKKGDAKAATEPKKATKGEPEKKAPAKRSTSKSATGKDKK